MTTQETPLKPGFAGVGIQGPAGQPQFAPYMYDAPQAGAPAPVQSPTTGQPHGIAMHAAMPDIPGQAQRLPHAIPAAQASAPVSAPAAMPGAPEYSSGPVINLPADICAMDDAIAELDKAIPQQIRKDPFDIQSWSHTEIWGLAEKLTGSRMIPAALRSNTQDLFILLCKAAVAGIPWPNAFTSVHAIPNKNGDLVMTMGISAKMGICRRHGSFSVQTMPDPAGKPVAIARGSRNGDPQQFEARFGFDDAALCGRMAIRDGIYVGTGGAWAQQWPHMLEIRAMGRLLDIMFPDLLAGITGQEEFDDIAAYEQDTSNQPGMTKLQEGITKTRRRRKEKVIAPESTPGADAAEGNPSAEEAGANAAPITPLVVTESADSGNEADPLYPELDQAVPF